MLIKFENKSNRVKGLAFHPRRPWILASLHNGCIQLWDYRMGCLLEKFEEHEGPVRGVDFHPSQPLFVSGGDDYIVKVWNYQAKRCLFNLLGHLDYIRSVSFHHEQPWVLTASDDQTIRIWNWQSRQCLSVLTGHNHYVMSARFSPTDDLVLSASLDQSVRVWDISGLRKKNQKTSSGPPGQTPGAPGGPGGPGDGSANDFFGGNDIVVKHVLEGHTRGVNWASFHPTLPLIVSGADDREIKLWRMNERRAWEVDTLRGHINNVSCVLFHPRKELIISNSEDKSIRIWDLSKTVGPQVYRRENDRHWILAAHPTNNLIASGHDHGLIVFKLHRERPPMHITRKQLYFYRDNGVHAYEFKNGKTTTILSTRRKTATAQETYRTIAYNTGNRKQHCILVTLDEGGSSFYELYVQPKDKGSDAQQFFRGFGRAAAWVSRNRFAVLDRSRQLWVKDLNNSHSRQVPFDGFLSNLFPGTVGRVLLRTPEGMVLYDVQVMKEVARFTITSRHPVKYVVWSPGHKYCAMFSKANLYIVNDKLEEQCSINEHARIKSGVWDPAGVFVYTTATHIKYVLANGDHGILRTLETPIYLSHVKSTRLDFIDRDGQNRSMEVDTTEYRFKVALLKRQHKEVLRIMRSNKLVGQSIIAYLHKKGFPEVALHFVQDPKTKFSLALECGNISVALECAKELEDAACWHRLGVEALRQGDHQVVEFAYQKTKNFERLSFLYLITGNTEKLSKMLVIAGLRGDLMARFHNALYLGNAEERVKVLVEAGQLRLAYLTACTHGLADMAESLRSELAQTDQGVPEVPQERLNRAKLMHPPTPILREDHWPLLEVGQGYFDAPAAGDEGDELEATDDDEDDDDDEGDMKMMMTGADGEDGLDKLTSEWGDLNLDVGTDGAENKEEDGGGWGGLDLGDLGIGGGGGDGGVLGEDGLAAGGENLEEYFVMPLPGTNPATTWQESSTLAADMIAAGAFSHGADLLHRQLGVINFAPLEDKFLHIFNTSRLRLTMAPSMTYQVSFLQRAEGLPRVAYRITQCKAELKQALQSVTEGKLEDALALFRSVVQTIPFVVVDNKASEQELLNLVGICREYITALRLELERRQNDDPQRQCLLAAYFAHCNIKPVHLVIGLKVAIKFAFAIKNFKMAGGFCRRILELAVSSNSPAITKIANPQQIRGVLKHCEKANTDAVQLDFDSTVSFKVCARTLTAIHKGTPSAECPYCKATYVSDADGSLCDTCDLSRIGANTTGLQALMQ